MLRAAGNAAIPRRVALWQAMRELLDSDDTHTGRVQASRKVTAEGSWPILLLHTRAEVGEKLAKLPMLLLDATMPVDVVRHYLPRLELRAEVYPAAPHMQVHQVVGNWGKAALCSHPKVAKPENESRDKLVGVVADFARLNSGGNGLVVTYQDIEQRFADAGLRTGHFNAIAGLDGFKDVRSLFVVGRPLPSPYDLRDMALALTGKPIAVEDPRNETRGALKADGTGVGMNVRAFDNPDLEALRVAITEAEVMQAIGRGRGVRRTADTPLDVFVLADVVLPLPLTSLRRWEDVRPGVVQRMAARGVVLLSGTDAAAAYPDVFNGAGVEAVKKAIARESAGSDFRDIPYRRSTIRECPGNTPTPLHYRPVGRGQQTRTAWVAPDRVEGLADWLAEMLGVPVTLHPGEAQEAEVAPVRKAAPEPAHDPETGEILAAPLPAAEKGPLLDDDPDPPSPPPGHPAADPGWGEYDTWVGGDGWEPVDSSGGWPGVDSTGADVAKLGDQVVGAEHRGGARMQVQPVADPSTGPRTWNAADPAWPGYPLRV